MSASQVLRQAEELKTAVQDTSRGSNEAWISRQNLQDLYQKLLVLDLEYALDKKVEQDLWNHAFKNQISTLQTQAKDKQNPKRSEILASLTLFLETASGFYLQLLEELCSAFKLDLPCRRKSSTIGILKEYGPVANKIKAPKKSSCMYICQHCLVHLGDIARYREESEQAQTYYRHAANLVPYNGQPYNQLAILEAAKGNKLSTVVYYVRSIAVKHPFPVASTNLEKFYTKITKDIPDTGRKLSMSELTMVFLQFNALIHLSIKLDVAKLLSQKFLSSLPSHVTSVSFTSCQLVQMIIVLLFTLHHAKRKISTADQSEDSTQKGEEPEKEEAEHLKNEELGVEEQKGYDLGFSLTASLLEVLLSYTPIKQEAKAKEYHTLPAIKVLLDWLHTDTDLINSTNFRNPNICHHLSKLLNILQFNANQKDVPIDLEKYVSVPLPEDCDLRCFLPLQSTHSDLDFHLMPVEGLSQELEMRLRCQRLVEHGLWLCEDFPSLNLINVQKQKSGRLHFSAPSSQVRILAGTDSDGSSERKSSYRQNVAIQAIMQQRHTNKKDTSTGPIADTKIIIHNNTSGSSTGTHGNSPGTSGKGHGKGGRKSHPQGEKSPQKSDAGIMVHTATETQEPQEKPIPSDAWEIPEPTRHPQPPQPQPQTHPNPQHPHPADVSYLDWAVAKGQGYAVDPQMPLDTTGKGTWPPQILQRQPAPMYQGQRPPDLISRDPDSMDHRDFPSGKVPTSPEIKPPSEENDQHATGHLYPQENLPGIMGNLPANYFALLQGLMSKENVVGLEGDTALFGQVPHKTEQNKTQTEQLQKLLQQQHLQYLLQHQSGSSSLGQQVAGSSSGQHQANNAESQQVQQQWLQQLQKQFQPQSQHQDRQQGGDAQFQQQLQHLENKILQTSEQLKVVSHQIQQKKQAAQHDKEMQVLQQQLQQLQLQQKQLSEPRQQQQLQQIIGQHEQKLMAKYQQLEEALNREHMVQQQLQQHQQQLLQQRQQMMETHNKQQQQFPNSVDKSVPTHDQSSWGANLGDRSANNMDLSQMMAVMATTPQGHNKRPRNQHWSLDAAKGQDPFRGTEDPSRQEDHLKGDRPMSFSPGSGKTNTSQRTFGFSSLGTDLKSPDNDFQEYPYSPQQASQSETSTTQSYLGNLFQGTYDHGKSLGGAFIPSSDSDEELHLVGEKMNKIPPFGIKSTSDLLSPDFTPTGLVLDLSHLTQEVPKPDSPPSTVSGLYGPSQDSSSYSLFSQSPWTVQLTSGDNKSHSSSPFGSSSSSLRTTPDPHTAPEGRVTPAGVLGGGLGLGYSLGAASSTPMESGWGALPKSLGNDSVTTTAAHTLPSNMQPMWTAGPSPLQKLLEQQKTQRQNDPH